MNIAVFCDRGFEETLSKHAPFDVDRIGDGVIFGSTQDVFKLYYTCTWATKILCDVGGVDYQLPDWWKDGKTFAIRTQGVEHSIIPQLATTIKDQVKTEVNLDNPDIVVVAVKRGEETIVGIDLAQKDLHKREYRIYTQPSMLRSSFAASCLIMAGYTGEQALLDPMCGSGTILIEAALQASNISPHQYAKHTFAFSKAGFIVDFHAYHKPVEKKSIIGYDHLLKRVRASQYNAKLAGVLESIQISRVEIEWLDDKVDEHSVDLLITHPPAYTDETARRVTKYYIQLLEQAQHVLKQDGMLFIVSNSPKPLSDLMNMEPKKVFMGQQPFYVFQTLINQLEYEPL